MALLPDSAPFPYGGAGGPVLILAHRGAHGPESPGVRENTVGAFERAAELGADGVELDVRRSADGTLVVHHDPATDGGLPIALSPTCDLPAWLPTFDQALDACTDLAVVNVELKASPLEVGYDPDHRIAADVAAVLALRPRPVVVSSFNLSTLDAFHVLSPATPTGWLTLPGFDQRRAARDAQSGGHGLLHPPDADVASEMLEEIHRLGLQVAAWTVNDGARIAALAAMGVDMVITDFPALARTTVG